MHPRATCDHQSHEQTWKGTSLCQHHTPFRDTYWYRKGTCRCNASMDSQWVRVPTSNQATTWLHTTSVGCIYASYPQYKSNIFQCLFNSFKILSKHQKLLKNIFLKFSVFLLTFVQVSFLFFCPMYCMKVCILLPPQGLISSQEALTGSLAQPDKLAVC